MKKIYAVAVIGIILIAVAILYPIQVKENENEVRVGAILSLTGDFGVFGNAMREGIEIAKDELNHGNISYKVIFEDDGLEISRAVEAGRKLTAIDGIHASFVTAANEGESLSSVFEEERTPLIVLFDSNSELTRGEYLYAMGFYNEGAARLMAEYAYNRLGLRTIAVIYSFDDWSNLMAETFRKEFETLGGKVIVFEGTQFDEKDFRTSITKSMNADAIYAPLVLPANMIRQAKELGYDGSVLSADSLNQDQIDASGNAADSVLYTNLYLEDNKKLSRLKESYRAGYGKEPEILELTAIGYDAMYAIDAAVRAKGIGRKQIKEGLYEIQFEGATGTVDFDDYGLSPRFERIFVVRDGKPVLVE